MCDLEKHTELAKKLMHAAKVFLTIDYAELSERYNKTLSHYHEKRHLWQEALEDYIEFFEKFVD